MNQGYILRRDKEENYFAELQNKALDTLQALSGNIWTDFNAHDPGVTITEVLHYTLLELQYILQLPFETYFANNSLVDFEAMGLYNLHDLTTPSIVTLSDYEYLIKKSIDEIIDCKITLSEKEKYHIKITVPSISDYDEIIQKVEKLYHANRNLCETLGEISFDTNDLKQKKLSENQNPLTPEFETADIKPNISSFFSDYYSIQNHFPDCYGVNEKGVPGYITNERKAQVLQLKAYLLIFDFLLANTHHQVNGISNLFNLLNNKANPYCISFTIKDMDKLINTDKFDNCEFENKEYTSTLKSNILDMLEVLYGEDINNQFHKLSNAKRAQLISILPYLKAHRFKSFNIQQSHSIPTIKQLMAAYLGYKIDTEITLDKLLGGYNLYLMSDKIFFKEYKNLNMESVIGYFDNQLLQYKFDEVHIIDVNYTNDSFLILENDLNFLWHNILFESLIKYGDNPEYYKTVSSPIRKQFVLAFQSPNSDIWINLGYFSDRDKLISTANLFWHFIEMLRSKSQLVYVIEHILLDDNNDDYNTLTIVVPTWSKWKDEPMFESFLREQMPAHLNMQLWWIEAEQTYEFEYNYFKWREALTNNDETTIKALSIVIRELISKQNYS